jgi:hypothetical protein
MRRIAQVLRVGVMSLYWHVANKETRQERFEFGLDCMLDGIAVRIAR